MNSIFIKLLGTPMVLKDGKKVIFPYMKAEALLYYMAVNKHATRDELVALFWGDSSETVAKKNLRNAMYKARKSFDIDIIISPQKSIVMLNPEISIEVDIDIFLNNKEKRIEIYEGEFLSGFIVRKAERFDEWVDNKRDYFKELYKTELDDNIKNQINLENFSKAEEYSRLLIKVDEFDERFYRILLDIYRKQGNYNKAIELYNKLSNILNNELGIEPDVETKELYDNIISLKDAQKLITNDEGNKKFFYGRDQEVSLITENYFRFIGNKDYKSFLISGEAGVGKSKLIEEIIDIISSNDVYILDTNCYQVEEKYFLKSWNSIFTKIATLIDSDEIDVPKIWRIMVSYIFPGFYTSKDIEKNNPIEKIDTLKFHVIEEAILGIFKIISKRKKIILVFEDLQWIDDMSISLLSSIILRNKNIIFYGTIRNTYNSKVEKFLTTLSHQNVIRKIELERFTQTQVNEFIQQYIPNIKVEATILDKIYKETEGNAFFLIEFLNMIKEKGYIDKRMTTKAQDILTGRFIDTTLEEQKLLDIISMNFDDIKLETILKLSGENELKIVDLLEELEKKFIIHELNKEDVSYRFTHQKLREFVYGNMSLGKRKILHKKISKILIELLRKKNDISIYPKLIYHLSCSGNEIDSLKYTIGYLDTFLDFTHELFPIVVKSVERNYLYMSNDQIIEYFNNIDSLFEKADINPYNEAQLGKLYIAFLHMKGRYFIREGNYDEGTKLILNMIESAISVEAFDYVIKGYKQMIYYTIQIHDIKLMEKYINIALDLASKYNIKEEIAVLLRLKGLNISMKKEYDKAEEILKNSIDIFKSIDNSMRKYSLNIAACYNYIGEIRRHNMKFSDALKYYDNAINICKEKRILRGLNIFNTNAGQAAFEMGDYLLSKNYLENAIEINNKIDSIWGRAIAEGYLSLLKYKEGKYKESMDHLKIADSYADKIKSPYEEGIVYRVKAEIRKNMDENSELRKVFSNYLDNSIKFYCEKGTKLLKKVSESYEIEILKALSK